MSQIQTPTLLVIGTDCKSNYHTITTAPQYRYIRRNKGRQLLYIKYKYKMFYIKLYVIYCSIFKDHHAIFLIIHFILTMPNPGLTNYKLAITNSRTESSVGTLPL